MKGLRATNVQKKVTVFGALERACDVLKARNRSAHMGGGGAIDNGRLPATADNGHKLNGISAFADRPKIINHSR